MTSPAAAADVTAVTATTRTIASLPQYPAPDDAATASTSSARNASQISQQQSHNTATGTTTIPTLYSSTTAAAAALLHKRPHHRLLVIDHTEFVCGWGAAFINITLTYPIYKIIFRQMLHGVPASSAFQQLRSEGISFLYRGIFPPLAQKTISLSLMFGVYDGTRRPMVDAGVAPMTAKIVAGLVAGTCEAALMPFERVQTLLADSTYHRMFGNTAQAFRYLLAEHGVVELYRGLWPILIRNGPSNSMFFVMREEVAGRLPVHSNAVTQTLQEFFAGALIGAIISSIFYPLNVVKVAMQSTMGTPRMSISEAFAHVYNERGRRVANVYKGVTVNCTRAFLSWGIMNTGYEHLKKILNTDVVVDGAEGPRRRAIAT